MVTLTSRFIIRSADPSDCEAISELIIRVASRQLRDEFTEEGWQLFLRLIGKQTLKGLIADREFQYWVALEDDTIVGMLCCKNHFHLFHFFIDTSHQGLGLGRLLWRHYLMHIPHHPGQAIEVKASDFARGFYLKLGFQEVSPRTVINGLYHTPMRYYINA